jgi:hypothetical protein
MDQLPPPPYSPRDPHSPTPSLSGSSDDTNHQSPPRASLRGGYLNIIDDTESVPESPTATYIAERPLIVQVPREVLHLEHIISPTTVQDELLFPSLDLELQLHDVSRQDWATFVNFIVAELQSGIEPTKGKNGGHISTEEFQTRQQNIESIIAEWNEDFFGPRTVSFTAFYQYGPTERGPSPAPSYRTFQTAIPPAGDRPYVQSATVIDPTSFQMPSHISPGAPIPGSMRVIPPQLSHPLFHPYTSGSAGPSHLHDHFNHMHRGHGWGPHGRGGDCHSRGRDLHFRGDGRGRGRDPHQRSASSSSSSSSSSSGGSHSRHGKRTAHRHSSSRDFSSELGSLQERRGRHGRRRGHHHRSDSSSSSSSSSSDSSASSLSFDDLEGVGDEDIKQSLEGFRQNPIRISHFHSAVRQLHGDIISRGVVSQRDLSDNRPNSTKEIKSKIKAQKKLIKSTIKEVKKDVRKEKRAIKRQHKAEKRRVKSERHLHKVAHRIRDIRLGGLLRTMPGQFPSDPPDPVETRRWESVRPRGFADSRSSAADISSMNEMASDVGKGSDHQSQGSENVDTQQESGVIAPDPGYTDDSKAIPVGTRETTPVPDERRGSRDSEKAAKNKKKEALCPQQRRQQARQAWQAAQQVGQQRHQAELQARQQEYARRLQASRHFRGHGRHGRHQSDAAETQRGQAEVFGQQEGVEDAVHPPGQSRSTWIPPFQHRPRFAPPPSAQGYGTYFENLGRGIEQWGERFGRDMEAWGERFGKDMESKFS